MEGIEKIMERAIIIVDNIAFEIADSNVQTNILAIDINDVDERAIFIERKGEFILVASSFGNDTQRDRFIRAIKNNTRLLLEEVHG